MSSDKSSQHISEGTSEVNSPVSSGIQPVPLLNAIRALILHLPEDVLKSIRVYGIESIEKLQSSPF